MNELTILISNKLNNQLKKWTHGTVPAFIKASKSVMTNKAKTNYLTNPQSLYLTDAKAFWKHFFNKIRTVEATYKATNPKLTKLLHTINDFKVVPSNCCHGFCGKMLVNDKFYANFVIAYSNKAGNVFLNQQISPLLQSYLQKQQINNPPHTIIYNLFDFSDKSVAPSMKLTLRNASTVGFDIINAKPCHQTFPPYQSIANLMVYYQQQQKLGNKNYISFISPHNLQLHIYNKNSLGTTLNQYSLMLCAIWRLTHKSSQDIQLSSNVQCQTKAGVKTFTAHNNTTLHALDTLFNHTTQAPSTSAPVSSIPARKLFYGAPGTGKSYHVQQLIDQYNKHNNIKGQANVFRATFSSNYTQQDFIGSLVPAIDKQTKKATIKFKPGVFARAYQDAKLHSNRATFLVLEEINHGNIASILGPVWQILDNGYQTSATNLTTWLLKNKVDDELTKKYKIAMPKNLVIYSTANLVGNNSRALGTDILRRLGIPYYVNIKGTKLNNGLISCLNSIPWNCFYQYTDYYITHVMKNNQTQLIGQWFINFNHIPNNQKQQLIDILVINKVLRFLWQLDYRTLGNNTIFKHRTQDGYVQTFNDIRSLLLSPSHNMEHIFTSKFTKGLLYTKKLLSSNHLTLTLDDKHKLSQYLYQN